MIFHKIEKDSVENPVSITIILSQEKHYKTKILGLNLVTNVRNLASEIYKPGFIVR